MTAMSTFPASFEAVFNQAHNLGDMATPVTTLIGGGVTAFLRSLGALRTPTLAPTSRFLGMLPNPALWLPSANRLKAIVLALVLSGVSLFSLIKYLRRRLLSVNTETQRLSFWSSWVRFLHEYTNPWVHVEAAPAAIESLDDHITIDQYAEEQQRDVAVLAGAQRAPRPLFVAFCANGAKNVFGLPNRIPANEICVRNWLVKFMKDHGHRPHHISRDIDMAVELVFTPSQDQLDAAWYRNAGPTTRRRFEMACAIAGTVQNE